MAIGRNQISDVTYRPRGNSFDIVVTDNTGVERRSDMINAVIISPPTVTQTNPNRGVWMRYKDTVRDVPVPSDDILRDPSWLNWIHPLYNRFFSSVTRSYIAKVPITLTETSVVQLKIVSENGVEATGFISTPTGTNTFNFGALGAGTHVFPILADSTTTAIWIWSYGSRFGIFEISVRPLSHIPSKLYGAESERPVNSFIGHQFYCTDTNKLTMYDGNEWKTIKDFQ